MIIILRANFGLFSFIIRAPLTNNSPIGEKDLDFSLLEIFQSQPDTLACLLSS